MKSFIAHCCRMCAALHRLPQSQHPPCLLQVPRGGRSRRPTQRPSYSSCGRRCSSCARTSRSPAALPCSTALQQRREQPSALSMRRRGLQTCSGASPRLQVLPPLLPLHYHCAAAAAFAPPLRRRRPPPSFPTSQGSTITLAGSLPDVDCVSSRQPGDPAMSAAFAG